MARPLRLEFPGALFHITARGNAKQDIFRDDADREFFLELLGRCVKRFDWILMAYVLMSNHYHLLIRLTSETLSRGMQRLDGQYPQRFNRRHRRVGHLLQGRFKAILVEEATYASEVLRYVVLNPVRASLVTRPEQYRWSSHRAVLGIVPAADWLAVDDVLAPFAPARDLARERYRQFVDAGIGVDVSPWSACSGQVYLGSEAWLQTIRERVDVRPRADEHPREQRLVGSWPMSAVVSAVARTLAVDEDRVRHGSARSIAVWLATHVALLTNAEIAAGLRFRSAGYVTRLLARAEREVTLNAGLRAWIDECLSTLRGDMYRVKT